MQANMQWLAFSIKEAMLGEEERSGENNFGECQKT